MQESTQVLMACIQVRVLEWKKLGNRCELLLTAKRLFANGAMSSEGTELSGIEYATIDHPTTRKQKKIKNFLAWRLEIWMMINRRARFNVTAPSQTLTWLHAPIKVHVYK